LATVHQIIFLSVLQVTCRKLSDFKVEWERNKGPGRQTIRTKGSRKKCLKKEISKFWFLLCGW